jgi:hypothetical protein
MISKMADVTVMFKSWSLKVFLNVNGSFKVKSQMYFCVVLFIFLQMIPFLTIFRGLTRVTYKDRLTM